MCEVRRIGRVLQVLKSNGETVYYDDMPYLDFFEGFLAVAKKGRWTFIDEEGDEICLPQYEDADYFSEGLAAVKMSSGWGFINTSGVEICPLRYSATGNFINGYARVKRDEKWLFINTQGKEICEPLFEDVCDFEKDGKAYVRSASQWGWLNQNGEVSWQGSLETELTLKVN